MSNSFKDLYINVYSSIIHKSQEKDYGNVGKFINKYTDMIYNMSVHANAILFSESIF